MVEAAANKAIEDYQLGPNPWQCSCGAWNPDEQDACSYIPLWKGSKAMQMKKQIPIAEYGDGVPWHHDESAVPLKEDNDEKIKKKIKVK